MNFETITFQPGAQPAEAILLLLHGVGSNEDSMRAAAAHAPAGCRVMALRAPIQLEQRRYAWFHVQFTSEGPLISDSEAHSSLKGLAAFVEDLRQTSGLPVWVSGFSQGAIMALALSLSHPGLVEGGLCFSGRFPEEFRNDIAPAADLKKLKLHVSHGLADEKLPIRYGRAVASLLQSLDVDHEYCEYPAGHQMTEAMLVAGFNWLEKNMAAAAATPPLP